MESTGVHLDAPKPWISKDFLAPACETPGEDSASDESFSSTTVDGNEQYRHQETCNLNRIEVILPASLLYHCFWPHCTPAQLVPSSHIRLRAHHCSSRLRLSCRYIEQLPSQVLTVDFPSAVRGGRHLRGQQLPPRPTSRAVPLQGT
jgi:hypothetical protein